MGRDQQPVELAAIEVLQVAVTLEIEVAQQEGLDRCGRFELDVEAFSQQWQVNGFWQYFAEALERLQPFMEDGLIEVYAERIKVTDAGRLWVRSICACFDAYLSQGQQRYSKVV